MPNSWTFTPARRAMTKWPSSWTSTSPTRIASRIDDVQDAVDDHAGVAVCAVGPTGPSRAPPRREPRARRSRGQGRSRSARPRQRRVARSPVKPRSPARNRSTATSSAAMSAADARGPLPAGLACDRERREADGVGRLERQGGVLQEVETRRGPGMPRRVADRVLDGDAHVRQAQLGLDRAVHELDERVDEALGMDERRRCRRQAHRIASGPR